MKKMYVKIDGIHCEHCEIKIKKTLLLIKDIKKVNIKNNIATIEYVNQINHDEIIKKVTDLGYLTKEENISYNINKIKTIISLKEFIIIFFSIIFSLILINEIFGLNVFNAIPNIDSSITYSMLFLTGLLTSIHCISMCGAINLIASTNNTTKRSLKKPILYNLGRVFSYTLIGGVVGLIGKAISINYIFMGALIITSAIVMFLMSLNMLGIVNFKLPKIIDNKTKKTNSFVIGLLNGFMPCGPLQAMELYALSTGSFIGGALSMLLFGLGTVPLMLAVGFAVNLIKGKNKVLINKVSAILILMLAIVMINRGLLALNIDINKLFNNYNHYQASIIEEEYQLVEFNLSTSGYENIIVQKDIPVKIIIHVDKTNLTGCNNKIIITNFNIEQSLHVGDNIILFTPTETGEFTYTCWMNMLRNSIKVIDDKTYFEKKE